MFAFMPYMHTENEVLQLEGATIFDKYYKATQELIYDHTTKLTEEDNIEISDSEIKLDDIESLDDPILGGVEVLG